MLTGGSRSSTLTSQPIVVVDLGGSSSRGSTRAECTVQMLKRSSGGAEAQPAPSAVLNRHPAVCSSSLLRLCRHAAVTATSHCSELS